jgi:hypothetical protein
MSHTVSVPFEFSGDLSQFRLPSGVEHQDAVDLVGQLARMTQELFECDVQIADDCDPAFPEDRNVVFIVQPRASVQKIIDNEARWVKRLRAIAPEWDAVRLSIRLPE